MNFFVLYLLFFFSLNSCQLQFNIVGQITDRRWGGGAGVGSWSNFKFQRGGGVVFWEWSGINRYFQEKNQGENV